MRDIGAPHFYYLYRTYGNFLIFSPFNPDLFLHLYEHSFSTDNDDDFLSVLFLFSNISYFDHLSFDQCILCSRIFNLTMIYNSKLDQSISFSLFGISNILEQTEITSSNIEKYILESSSFTFLYFILEKDISSQEFDFIHKIFNSFSELNLRLDPSLIKYLAKIFYNHQHDGWCSKIIDVLCLFLNLPSEDILSALNFHLPIKFFLDRIEDFSFSQKTCLTSYFCLFVRAIPLDELPSYDNLFQVIEKLSQFLFEFDEMILKEIIFTFCHVFQIH